MKRSRVDWLSDPAATWCWSIADPWSRTSATIAITPRPPANVLEGSFADVSFLAGMLIDKFCYHLPLYRQHQRLAMSGITVSRSTLTQQVEKAIALLKPIYDAQLKHILLSKVLAMDETPTKAGRGKPGKMKQAWFWPVYGQDDEVCFIFSPFAGHSGCDRCTGRAL
jgi:transposase